MSALIFIATRFIAVPYFNGIGYFNLGDCLILFTSILIGPIEGIFSGIIGSVISDLTSGFSYFIPFTIFAKALEALVCYLLFYLLKKYKYIKYISFFIGPLFMVLIYFIAYYLLGGVTYALTSSSFDLLQGVIASILSIILLELFKNFNIPGTNKNLIMFYKKNENKKDKTNV